MLALTGVTTALCVRAPMVVTGTAVVALFVAGNLVGAVEHAAAAGSWAAQAGAFVSGLIVPDQGAMAFSAETSAIEARMPLAAIVWAGAYAMCCALAGMLAGVVLFRRREVM